MPYARTLPVLAIAAAVALAAGPLAARADDANVPESVMQELSQKFRLSRRPTSRQELAEMRRTACQAVLAAGKDIEAKYPAAGNLYQVRQRMLVAADFLAQADPGAETKARKLQVAKRMVDDAKAPAEAKVTPDYFLTVEAVAPDGKAADDARKQIDAFIARYADSEVVGLSLVRASQLAAKAGLTDVENKLLDQVAKDHADNPQIIQYLKSKGRSPMIGKPFVAELPLLDGSTLKLPEGRAGKVVVVDFWATWCGPCIGYLPHMKKVYNQYKDKNVAFIGVSLDRAGQKDKLAAFVKKNGMTWTHAYSGKYWSDPTARKYGVSAIPAIWVIGKDGKIFSDTARSNLEETIDKALAQEVKAEE